MHSAVRHPQFEPTENFKILVNQWLAHCSKQIYIYGIPGNGKTTAMLWLYHHMVTLGLDVQYVSARDLVDKARSCFTEGRSISQMMDRFVNCGCLLLDDLGAERLTDFTLFDVIYPLINHRLDRSPSLPTVIASNLNFPTLLAKYSEIDPEESRRLVSRIIGNCAPIGFNSQSHRIASPTMWI
jgi:DNA replication protein DnaC